jgi:hypothetical protein
MIVGSQHPIYVKKFDFNKKVVYDTSETTFHAWGFLQ